jgi:hypothetical protein
MLAGVHLFLFFYGTTARVFLEKPVAQVVAEPFQAFEVWEREGVKGRILLLFDRRLNADTEGRVLSRNNYIYWAIGKNMVRKIYHVIPDSSWGEVEAALTGRDDVVPVKEGFRTNIEGAPLHILRIKHIPRIEERVLILINGDYWSESDILSMINMIQTSRICSDSMVISGKFSGNSFQQITALYATSR